MADGKLNVLPMPNMELRACDAWHWLCNLPEWIEIVGKGLERPEATTRHAFRLLARDLEVVTRDACGGVMHGEDATFLWHDEVRSTEHLARIVAALGPEDVAFSDELASELDRRLERLRLKALAFERAQPTPEGSDDGAEPEEPEPHQREASTDWPDPEAPPDAPEARRLGEAFEAQREFVHAVEHDLMDFSDRIASRHSELLRAYGQDLFRDIPPVPERPGRAGSRTEAIARRHGAPEPEPGAEPGS